MHLHETDIAFIHKLQALGNDNVYLGGSLLMAMIGVRKHVKDIDVILDNPTEEQAEFVKTYEGKRLDFLRYREETPPNKSLRYKGIPLDRFENIVKFKANRAFKKDYIDMFNIINWLVTNKPEGVDIDASIQTIVDEVVAEHRSDV